MNEKVKTLECLGKNRIAMEQCNSHYREPLYDSTDTSQVSIDNARQNIKLFYKGHMLNLSELRVCLSRGI